MNQKTILRTVLIAVLSLVATAAAAHSFEVDGIYYNKNGDGTVSVTFKGSRYYEYADEYTGNVMIPSSVTYSGTTYSCFRHFLGAKFFIAENQRLSP